MNEKLEHLICLVNAISYVLLLDGADATEEAESSPPAMNAIALLSFTFCLCSIS